ncbi:hypothetical protein SDC9_163432 [bioreactor metagenome]|uniref:Uncharacterized protein n=1 Tax=bioreactor metagenome TaxID=1076179 RepID=A0A645FVP3_9ZZZZ
MLDAGAGDADGIALLEGILADVLGRDLAAQHDHRDGIHVRGGNAGHRIGHARTGRHQRNADLLRRARIGVCGMNGGLLMANQDVLDVLLLEKGVVNMQNGTAWVTEHIIDLFFLQAPDYNFCTADHHS